jgi:hypothetical protein
MYALGRRNAKGVRGIGGSGGKEGEFWGVGTGAGKPCSG